MGMKLVFIHGAGCSSLSFYYQLRHFRSAKAIDCPAIQTANPATPWTATWNGCAGLSGRDATRTSSSGHSMGGAIAMRYALKYPEELRGLILMGTGARLRVHPQYLERCREPGEGSAPWLEDHLDYYRGVSEEVYPVLKQRAAEVGPAVELNDLMACDSFDMMECVSEINLPTRVICGSEDVMTPVKYSDFLTNNIQGAVQSIIPGGGHFAHMEKFQQVNEEIEDFLATFKSSERRAA